MPETSALGARSAGVWSRAQALETMTPGRIQARVRRGEWQVPFRGVYADGGSPLTAVQWAAAATLVGASPADRGAVAVASGRSAARVWELPLIDDNDPVTGAQEKYLHEVVTPQAVRGLKMPAGPGEARGHELIRHRHRLRQQDVVRHPAGFWVTTPLRTTLDCVSALGLAAGVCLLDDGLRRRLLHRSDLVAAGRPSRVLREAVSLADARAESAAESLARLLLLPALPGLVPQVRIWDRGLIVARVDLGDEEIKLAVEVDSRRWHSGEQMVAKDRARDRRTEARGWTTERCMWRELRREPEALVERVVARDAQLRSRAA